MTGSALREPRCRLGRSPFARGPRVECARHAGDPACRLVVRREATPIAVLRRHPSSRTLITRTTMTDQRHPLDAQAIGMMVVLSMLWGFQQVAVKLAAHGVSLVMQGAR